MTNNKTFTENNIQKILEEYNKILEKYAEITKKSEEKDQIIHSQNLQIAELSHFLNEEKNKNEVVFLVIFFMNFI